MIGNVERFHPSDVEAVRAPPTERWGRAMCRRQKDATRRAAPFAADRESTVV
jgi:hypothetical protein